ncbi:hypothetical protein [Brevundimonas nasdae]|uniref:Uncharacterized protein n=1 Tax=Brevundimonas nasdae TaxID=172043 RepID=A0ACD4VK82_9CAUL|nr:hypothetical protein [Brevundimonas nasdae]WOB78349.1 hypothetical protein PZA08_13715 [Brevundimonas nasdae]
MTDWPELYRVLVGQTLGGIVWMPISSDTPQLAAEMQMSAFSFSGAAHVRFANNAFVQLSWQQKGDRFVLATGSEAVWVSHALDRLQAQGDRWLQLIGSTLDSVELFTLPDDHDRHTVAAKHNTSAGSFWIGVGGADFVGDHDDLWVGVDCDPPNRAGVVSLGIVS